MMRKQNKKIESGSSEAARRDMADSDKSTHYHHEKSLTGSRLKLLDAEMRQSPSADVPYMLPRISSNI